MEARNQVLVVDDEPTIRSVLRFVLEEAGFEVSEASGGTEAIAHLKKSPPTCMVLDLSMPKVDGLAVLRARRDERLAPQCRILVLTAKTAERDFLHAWEMGADGYETKPFNGESLVAKLEELLATPAAELARRRRDEVEKAKLLERLERAITK